jgi:hypothetical protein
MEVVTDHFPKAYYLPDGRDNRNSLSSWRGRKDRWHFGIYCETRQEQERKNRKCLHL